MLSVRNLFFRPPGAPRAAALHFRHGLALARAERPVGAARAVRAQIRAPDAAARCRILTTDRLLTLLQASPLGTALGFCDWAACGKF